MFSLLCKRCIRSAIKSVKNRITFKTYATENSNKIPVKKSGDRSVDEILGSIATKYQVFRNEDANVILDVNEQQLQSVSPVEIEQIDQDEFEGLNIGRGVTGVYEIEDLVEVLRRENAIDLFVATVPPQVKYVDYICVVSGKSYRHMLAIAEFVRRLFKMKRNPNDGIPKIEGAESRDWIAMDLGNIALHIFSKEARTLYDLDSLWALGEEFDDECNKPDDPIVQLLQKHSIYLRDLVPADSET